MKEILISGDVTKEFKRLGVEARQTYTGKEYGVCEVTEGELEILCDEPDEVEGTWEDCGWRYCEGSNQGQPNTYMKMNGLEITGWYNPIIDDEEDEEEYKNYIPVYRNLLTYLCEEMGCSTFRNVCALTKDLAKYNDMKLSELFDLYQKE